MGECRLCLAAGQGKRMKMKAKKNRGFSLIELVIVVAILAILVGLLAPAYTKYVKKSKVAKCETQREELERVFRVACVEDARLAGCKDTIEVKNVLGGQDPIDYLGELGYYDKDAAVCPVYHEKYTLEVSTIRGQTTVEVLCPCVDTVAGYIAGATKIYEDKYKDKNSFARESVIKDFYDERGSLLKVSDGLKAGTNSEDLELYWRPYVLKDGKVVLFASDSNNSGNAQWRACLLYKDGKVYQCEDSYLSGRPPGANVASLRDVTSDTFDTWLGTVGKFEAP